MILMIYGGRHNFQNLTPLSPWGKFSRKGHGLLCCRTIQRFGQYVAPFLELSVPLLNVSEVCLSTP